MRRFFCFLAACLLLSACAGVDPDPVRKDGTSALDDPGFTVSGLPGSRITPGSSFSLTVSTKSDGAVDFMCYNPSAVSVVLKEKHTYAVSVNDLGKETNVIIRFYQKASGNYAEAEYVVSFIVAEEEKEFIDPTIPSGTLEDLDGVKVSFSEAKGALNNPERGIYRSKNFRSASYPATAAEVTAQRLAGYTLWYYGFYLTDFMKGDISQKYLDMFQKSMDALREGGAKCMLRFAYKDYMSDSEDMDPEVNIVLRHIEQLKPYLQKNEDVIFVMQAGFVGPWGEWHSSTHFGSSYEKRKQLTDALLDALPESRQIQLRTPQFKMRMYDLKINDTITVATAHNGSDISRLGGHNDCFGASKDDYGTFDNQKDDREFWKADTRYTIMGGETCGLSDFCTCDATRKDMVEYHWTLLNKDYNGDVLKRWSNNKCYDEFASKLGYRLVMKDLFYSEDFAAGRPCSLTLRLFNAGYAAPMNPREAILVWKASDGAVEETPLGSDPRTWHTGYNIIQTAFSPSSNKGTLYLKLSDPLLPGRPEYCIALANENVFDQETGLNKLFEIR